MKKIKDIRAYTDSLRETGSVVYAVKTGFVLARRGREGETVETYVANGMLETTNRVKRDEAGAIDIVVSTANAEGEKIVDAAGHTNTYVMTEKAFREKYANAEAVAETERLFRSRGKTQAFLRIPEDISITAPWGEEQDLKAGGFLNVTDPDDVYGIAYEEFSLNYAVKTETDPG